MGHVFVEGPIEIGDDNLFYPYSTVGVAPQDLKYKGERSETKIGHRNLIREFVTIHRGTEGGGMLTSIGSDNLLSAYTHVAHDVRIGNHTVLSHGATLGGHVLVDDYAVVGAYCGIHQFCRVGRFAMIGGYSVVTQDVLPFATTVSARENKIFGANRVGLERRGYRDDVNRAFADSIPPLDAGRLEYHAGDRAHQGRTAANRRTDRIARFHRAVRARIHQVKYGLIAGNGRFPILALEMARLLGHEIVAIGNRGRSFPRY